MNIRALKDRFRLDYSWYDCAGKRHRERLSLKFGLLGGKLKAEKVAQKLAGEILAKIEKGEFQGPESVRPVPAQTFADNQPQHVGQFIGRRIGQDGVDGGGGHFGKSVTRIEEMVKVGLLLPSLIIE